MEGCDRQRRGALCAWIAAIVSYSGGSVSVAETCGLRQGRTGPRREGERGTHEFGQARAGGRKGQVARYYVTRAVSQSGQIKAHMPVNDATVPYTWNH